MSWKFYIMSLTVCSLIFHANLYVKKKFQISSRSLRLGANRRKEITEELISVSPMVIQLLTHVVSGFIFVVSPPSQIHDIFGVLLFLKAVLSWADRKNICLRERSNCSLIHSLGIKWNTTVMNWKSSQIVEEEGTKDCFRKKGRGAFSYTSWPLCF